jgi:lipopolysaccharide heptosyltransferase II
LNVGGVETGALDLAKYLTRFGHGVVVVSAGGELVKELESYGARHYQLPVHRKSLFTVIKMSGALAEIIRKEKIEIVHAHSRVPAWIAFFACRMTGTVFITTCHGYYNQQVFSHVMGWSKRVVVLSNVIARHMIEDFRVPVERIRLVPRGVDLEKFKYSKPDEKRGEDFNVGIIGRITPIKGHLDFIKAMAKVARAVPRLKIWIVGDAPASREAYKDQIRVLVRRLGLSHCTEFLGTQRDIPAVLAHLDVLVLATTTHEAFGRVVIEAQASGVPVVATKVGGVVDIIENEKNGLLVAPADPAGMGAAVIRIFKDLGLARDLAECAYKKVQEKYTVELMVENKLKIYQEALNNFKVLIIKFSSLGDVVLSSAGLRAIRGKFPVDKYKISLLTSEEAKDALLGCPYIDELLVADLKNKDKGFRGLLNLAYILRKKNFDYVIDLQNNRKSHILSALSLSTERFGYNNKKFGFLLNHSIRDEKPPIGPVEHQFRILKMLGIDLSDAHLELWPGQEDRQYVEELLSTEWLSSTSRIIGINIAASIRWQTKAWPLKHLVSLCQELGRRDLRVVITGTVNDLAQAEALINAAKDTKIINACAKTSINQLACLIKKCSVYISSDTSSLHVAAAMGVPFVALFGPTDPRRHLAPAKDYALIKKDLPCSPCYKPKCRRRDCMELISPQEVLAAVEKLLK